MGKYANVFRQVGNAKELNDWEPALPVGRHRVAMIKYGGKESSKNKSQVFLEAEFIVLSTNVDGLEPGSCFSWMWPIHKPDDHGYVFARARKFVEVVQESAGAFEDSDGNPVNTEMFGDFLDENFRSDSPTYYGLLLDVDVTTVYEKDGVTPMRSKKGAEITNADWQAIAQDDSDVAATRARLVELANRPVRSKSAVPTKPATPPEPTAAAPETSAPPATTGARKPGGLGALTGKRV